MILVLNLHILNQLVFSKTGVDNQLANVLKPIKRHISHSVHRVQTSTNTFYDFKPRNRLILKPKLPQLNRSSPIKKIRSDIEPVLKATSKGSPIKLSKAQSANLPYFQLWTRDSFVVPPKPAKNSPRMLELKTRINFFTPAAAASELPPKTISHDSSLERKKL